MERRDNTSSNGISDYSDKSKSVHGSKSYKPHYHKRGGRGPKKDLKCKYGINCQDLQNKFCCPYNHEK